jgi:hypothetical protein
MWDQVVENNELAGMWLWLWPQQCTVLPKYVVLMVVSIKIAVLHNMTSYQLGKGQQYFRGAQILKLELGTPPGC